MVLNHDYRQWCAERGRPETHEGGIRIWFGIITRQAIRRGTFVSVNHLVHRIRAYVEHWNATAEPFVWTATAEDILAKVRLVQTNVTKLVQNNSK
jgi:hypothetical protein